MRGRSLVRHKQQNKHVSHVVHADGSQTTETVTSPINTTHDSKYRKRLFYFAGIIFVAICIFIISDRLILNVTKTSPGTVLVPEEKVTELVKEAVQKQSGPSTDMKMVVDKIKATPDYATNQNLLYIEFEYYVATGDSVNARKTYDILAKIYNPDRGFTDDLGDTKKTIEDLKSEVEFLEARAKSLNDYKIESN